MGLYFLLNYDVSDSIPAFFNRMNSVSGPSFNSIPPAAFGMYMKVGGQGLIGGAQLDTMLNELKGRNAILVTSLDPVEGYDNVSQAGLEDFADKIATFNKFGIPVFIRPAHEMNGPWYIYGMQPNKFKAYYRNVYNTVKRKAPFAKFIFAPMEGSGYPWASWLPVGPLTSEDYALVDTNSTRHYFLPSFYVYQLLNFVEDGRISDGDEPYNPYYPGDDVVDWFGVSLYWKGDYPYNVNQVCPTSYFADKLVAGKFPTYQFAQTHNKPMMITEMAGSYCATNPGTSNLNVKQPFWKGAFGDDTRKKYPLLKLALWFDYNKYEEGGQRDFSISDTSGPNGGSLQQVAPAFKQDLSAMSKVVYASNVELSSSGNCGCFKYSSSGSALDRVVNTFTTVSVATQSPGIVVSPSPPSLGDWEFCTANSQCLNKCCSKEYSNDGKYKCTPGGSQCTNVSALTTTLPTSAKPSTTTTTFTTNRPVSPTTTTTTTTKPPTTTTTTIKPTTTTTIPVYQSPALYGDWEFCTSNSQCANRCCSKEYSNDGKYKCTPGGTVCVAQVSTIAITTTSTTTTISKRLTTTVLVSPSPLGEWAFCTSSAQCANRCCSKQYSGDGKYKCTPGSTLCI
ncbi:hypothetical protein HK098_006671 [Nowakowskiella sp. JEL0407]|nr:hypothetical protein HK098_006671 [Nowakowskiella sp. JEL0407]